jgi:hypothetical protein
MKRQWEPDDLVSSFTFLPDEATLLANKTGATRLGFAVLYKFFQHEGRFPRHRNEVPNAVIAYLAKCVHVPAKAFSEYTFTGRTVEYHRAQIREALGFRQTTVQDAKELTTWLCKHVLTHDYHSEHLKVAVHNRCRSLRLEPPSQGRTLRII